MRVIRTLMDAEQAQSYNVYVLKNLDNTYYILHYETACKDEIPLGWIFRDAVDMTCFPFSFSPTFSWAIQKALVGGEIYEFPTYKEMMLYVVSHLPAPIQDIRV